MSMRAASHYSLFHSLELIYVPLHAHFSHMHNVNITEEINNMLVLFLLALSQKDRQYLHINKKFERSMN